MPADSDRTLADLVLVTQTAFVVFVVLGLLLILSGAFAGCRWIRNPWFRAAQLAAFALVVGRPGWGDLSPDEPRDDAAGKSRSARLRAFLPGSLAAAVPPLRRAAEGVLFAARASRKSETPTLKGQVVSPDVADSIAVGGGSTVSTKTGHHGGFGNAITFLWRKEAAGWRTIHSHESWW